MEGRKSRITGVEKGILGISQKIGEFFHPEGKFDYFRLILVIAIIYLLYAILLLGYQRLLYAMEIHKTEQFIREVERENEKMQSQINYLNTPQGTEQTVREKLGLVKPGESAVQLVDPGKKAP